MPFPNNHPTDLYTMELKVSFKIVHCAFLTTGLVRTTSKVLYMHHYSVKINILSPVTDSPIIRHQHFKSYLMLNNRVNGKNRKFDFCLSERKDLI